MPHESAPRVLVADDQADVLTALRLLLKEGQFEADTARSIPEIRAKLEAGPYDLLLMDLNYARDTTSGREGLDLLAQVHERDPLLPVVVMTGWASIETAVEAMRRGARTFVHKPWENAALFDTLRREVAHGRAARLAQRSASREQEEAQAIQRALLPALTPVVPGCELAARWRPATAFGGDFYDVVRLDGRGLMVTIGDVCGKGLPAALLMANVQASMRAFAAADASPKGVAARINRELAANAALRRFVTLFYGIYDAETRRFTFTNAGHNPPIVVRADGSIERLTVGGMVLGAFDTATYDEHVIMLRPGDRLVLFTDGMIERAGADDDEFGDERLVDAARRRRADPAAALADALFEEITALAGGRLDDDATVMVMAIR
jgi:sigma-B regulation protein RsbU (phosphoserine phosphatase)